MGHQTPDKGGHQMRVLKKNSPKLDDGPTGFIDASGFGIAIFVGPAKLDSNVVIFAGATKNDIPSV
jgi:hypothetical protein